MILQVFYNAITSTTVPSPPTCTEEPPLFGYSLVRYPQFSFRQYHRAPVRIHVAPPAKLHSFVRAVLRSAIERTRRGTSRVHRIYAWFVARAVRWHIQGTWLRARDEIPMRLIGPNALYWMTWKFLGWAWGFERREQQRYPVLVFAFSHTCSTRSVAFR